MITLPAPEIAAFALSALGGLHCAGMCGGFIGALQLHRPASIPVARWAAAYHVGRIASYATAGALAGALGESLFATRLLPLQVLLLAAGGLMLLLIGASMFSRATGWLRRLEPAGVWLWLRLQPVARRVYPPRSTRQALLAGLAWGWIPCGMVYAALPLALVAGGPLRGASVMGAFGIGTLPALVLVDSVAARWRAGGEPRAAGIGRILRPLAGVLIVVFGLSSLAHAAQVAGARSALLGSLASICHHRAAALP
ncbi:MAG TPA: sulfite exporter TauE/SafE family protein [Burkholderiaceae bacterium]|nr:sulfite exporter TauE/SafE family protein [Burkholderiaceae bacterium]